MKKHFCTIDDKIAYICRNDYSYFLNKKNVLGVGFGYKIRNGFDTCKECIKIFVSTKIPINKLNNNDKITPTYKGFLTDIVDSGYIYTHSLTKRIRPTICGYSIGPEIEKNEASIGCIVMNKGIKYILTCKHGIILDNGDIGINVIQPSNYNEGIAPKDNIGYLARYIPVYPMTSTEKPENLVDACIIRPYDSSMISTEIYGVGKIKGIGTPKVNQSVVKVGAITEITTGKITSLHATMRIRGKSAYYVYTDQIITTAMTEKGDSGSVLLANGNLALGLLTAGSNSCGIYSDIQNITKLLDVTIIS